MLTRFRVSGFRNLDRLDFDLPSGSLLVSGNNGAGKTSLLEALYLLVTTRSFRTARPIRCCRHGTDSFRIEGEFTDQERRVALALGLIDGKRWRTLNGESSPLEEYLAVSRVVCWTNTTVEVVSGGPEARRRFIDRGVVGLRPSRLKISQQYRQVLGQKRRLLLQGAQNPAGLRDWNQLLAKFGAQLISVRREYCRRLTEAFDQILAHSSLEIPPIELVYSPSPAAGLEGDPATIEKELAGSIDREKRVRRALIGPHLDRLVIKWGASDVRHVASAGETKILGLALLAAQQRVFQQARLEPLLLLDDLDSELDRGRLREAWKLFDPVPQSVVTTSRPEAWSEIETDARLDLSKGSIVAFGGNSDDSHESCGEAD